MKIEVSLNLWPRELTCFKVINCVDDRIDFIILKLSFAGESHFSCQKPANRHWLTHSLAVNLKHGNLTHRESCDETRFHLLHNIFMQFYILTVLQFGPFWYFETIVLEFNVAIAHEKTNRLSQGLEIEVEKFVGHFRRSSQPSVKCIVSRLMSLRKILRYLFVIKKSN